MISSQDILESYGPESYADDGISGDIIIGSADENIDIFLEEVIEPHVKTGADDEPQEHTVDVVNTSDSGFLRGNVRTAETALRQIFEELQSRRDEFKQMQTGGFEHTGGFDSEGEYEFVDELENPVYEAEPAMYNSQSLFEGDLIEEKQEYQSNSLFDDGDLIENLSNSLFDGDLLV